MPKPLNDEEFFRVEKGFGGRLAVDEIRYLRIENEALRAKCAGMQNAARELVRVCHRMEIEVLHTEEYCSRCMDLIQPFFVDNPGQPLLDELERLRTSIAGNRPA